MAAEEELAAALRAVLAENTRLQADNARLRDVLATYPQHQQSIASVLAEMRGLLWQLVDGRGRRVAAVPEGDEDLFEVGSGIPPAPDLTRWMPSDTGPAVQPGSPASDDETGVHIPEEPQWPREEA